MIRETYGATAITRVMVGRTSATQLFHGRDPGGTVLMAGSDVGQLKRDAVALCAKAFGTTPTPGVVTYVSRGTDDDAHGVLAGFGLTGDITRRAGDDGLDIVHVTLHKADLDRIPESQIHTALEASLNCEVHIRTV
jgi:hypothetical protein